MMNPNLEKWFGATSRIKQCNGISDPLHFRFQLDSNGRGCMLSKMDSRQELWSEAYYPLKCPNNALDDQKHPCKLKLEDIDMVIKKQEVSYISVFVADRNMVH